MSGDTFITEICEVEIPEVPGAYNASFIPYEDGYLMAFRFDTYRLPTSLFLSKWHHHIGLVTLDKNFKTTHPPLFFPMLGYFAYDPRLVRINEKIYIVFGSPHEQATTSTKNARLMFSEVCPIENGDFVISPPVALRSPFQRNFEKNWIPFAYQQELLFVHTICPHVILSFDLRTGDSIPLFESQWETKWRYGEIRGGTPALLVDDHYLAIFHSSSFDRVTKRYTYYMGAYTFASHPPFEVTQISYKPFNHEDFYSTPSVPICTAKVVFPMGISVDGENILVSYGENDGGIKVMKIDRKLLYESMYNIHEEKL